MFQNIYEIDVINHEYIYVYILFYSQLPFRLFIFMLSAISLEGNVVTLLCFMIEFVQDYVFVLHFF